MKIVVYPEHIDFGSGTARAKITVSKIIRFDPLEGFVRVNQCVWFVSATGRHRCRLNAGIYEVRTDDGSDFLVLLPQRVGLSVEVARELLENPHGLPQPRRIAQPFAKALTDLIENGMSWADATTLLGLGPNGEFPTRLSIDSTGDKGPLA